MMTKEEQIKEILERQIVAGKPLEVQIRRHNRVFVTIPRENLRAVVEICAKQLGSQHISTITSRDTGSSFEILYHFFIDGVEVTIRTSCPRDDPMVDSIVDMFPGAILYEREIHDILGIVPKNHPDLRRLVLPENWAGGYPLRKDWKPEGGETHG